MSSNRLPGKVLMPFQGQAIIQNVVNAAGADKTVVLTSTEPSDDPLVEYLESKSISFFRGSLNDVYGRFCDAIDHFEPEWVMRICADSPLIPTELLKGMEDIKRGNADLISNVFSRTFPKGHSVEIIRAKTMMDTPKENLTADDKEHVTTFFYRNAKMFNITSVTQEKDMQKHNLAVDTRDDYDRLSRMNKTDIVYDPAMWRISTHA